MQSLTCEDHSVSGVQPALPALPEGSEGTVEVLLGLLDPEERDGRMREE